MGVWEDFYYFFMTDPFMNELFDARHKDVMVSNKEHAKRIGLFFLSFMGDDNEYPQQRGGVGGLNSSHKRAKGCPMRGKRQGK